MSWSRIAASNSFPFYCLVCFKPFLKIFSQEIFKDLLSIVQLSRFFVFAICSSDSFNRLSHRFLFVNNFFQVLSFSLDVCRRMIQDHIFCTYGFQNETSPLYPSGSQAPVCKSFLFCSCPLSDEDYLTIVSINCQRFSCFLFISCNSDNNRISRF